MTPTPADRIQALDRECTGAHETAGLGPAIRGISFALLDGTIPRRNNMKKAFALGTICAALTLGVAPASLAASSPVQPGSATESASTTPLAPAMQKNGIMKVKATFFNDTNRTLKLTDMGELKPGHSIHLDGNSDAAGIHYEGVAAWVENHHIGRPDFNVQADATDASPEYVALSESSGKWLEYGGRKYYAHRHADDGGKQRFDIHIHK